MNFTHADILAAQREISQRHLADYFRLMWPQVEPVMPYSPNWHLDAICEHLEAVTAGHITRLLINVPPGFTKSLTCSVAWQTWEWGPKNMPSLRYLCTSFGEGPIKRDTRKARDLMLSPWYQQLWPHVKLTRTAETSFANTRTGTREGVPFPSLTSQRGDRLIIDDPHSTETAESDAERQNTVRRFREGAMNRLNDQMKSAIVVIMQRLHANDVSGEILARHTGFEHLCIPMEYEHGSNKTTSIGWVDPRTVDGELLDPKRFPPEAVTELKQMGEYAYHGQYQQRPTSREGGLFKRAWFDGKIKAERPKGGKCCRAWDFAGTVKKTGNKPDWTAGLRMWRIGTDYWVDHVTRFQESPGVVMGTVKTYAQTDPFYTTIRLPQDPGQAGKAQAENYIKELAGRSVKVLPVTGDKETRARPCAVQAEAGNIYLVEGDWNAAFLDEVCTFPMGAHDDQVDALSDAFNELALGYGYTLDNV